VATSHTPHHWPSHWNTAVVFSTELNLDFKVYFINFTISSTLVRKLIFFTPMDKIFIASFGNDNNRITKIVKKQLSSLI